MKTRLTASLAAIALTLAPAASARAAAFTNGSFEGYTAPTDGANVNSLTPASWASVGTATWRNTSAGGVTAQDGSAFVGFFGGAGGNGISQTFDTEAGKTYTLTYYLAQQTGGGPPVVNVDVFNGTGFGGANLGADTHTINWTQDTWRTWGVTFTATSGTTTVRFQETAGSQSASVDTFLDTVRVEGPNLLTNGAFEGGFTGWTNGGTVLRTDGSPMLAHSGNSYIAMFDPGSTSILQSFATVIGETYDVSFYLARQTTAGVPDVNVDVFDGIGTGGTNLTGGDDTFLANGAVGQWLRYTLSFVAQSTSSTLRFMENGGSSGVDPFLDTVTVTGPEAAVVAIPAPAALPAALAMLTLTALRRWRD